MELSGDEVVGFDADVEEAAEHVDDVVAWNDTMRPRTCLPSLAASLAVITITAAAPSLMPEAGPR